jgi:hypothetical protein
MMCGVSSDDAPDRIAGVRRGYSILDEGSRFAIKYPLGITRIEWEAVDGLFEARSDNSVTFNLKPEWLARRSFWFRLGVRLTRAQTDANLRIAADSFGLTAKQLAAALNARLSRRLAVSQSPSESEPRPLVRPAKPDPLRRLVNRTTWVVAGILLLLLLFKSLR